MNEPLHLALQRVWQQQSAHHGWKLVDDETHFLRAALIEALALACLEAALLCLRNAVRRTYSVHLHRGLQARRDQAAMEIHQALYRTALRRRMPDEAEECAQEAIAMILKKLPQLREPRSLFAWAFRILATVEQRLNQHAVRESAPLDETLLDQIVDPTDLEAQIVAALSSSELLQAIVSLIPNTLERTVVLDTIVYNANPRDTATRLGIDSTRVRVAKNRGMERLKNQPSFLDLLRRLADPEAPTL